MNVFRGNDDNDVSSNKSDLEGNLVGLTKGELERYERQILRIGVEGQKILKSKSVLQVGAGGLGSPLAYYLVAAGVGRLIIIDDDKVSLSNLNRQILYSVDDLGKMKAEVAKRKLEFLNPGVKIDAISGRLTKENYRDYIKGVDYLIDASDNLKTKYLINDIGLETGIPFTIAGVQGMEGQIISVTPSKSACYRCIFGDYEEYNKEDVPSMDDKESLNANDNSKLSNKKNEQAKAKKKPIEIFGFSAGVLGALEAAEAIKYLLGVGKRIVNALLMVDLEEMKFMKVEIKQNPNCICSKIKN